MPRLHIQAVCNRRVHLFPVSMRYGGTRFRSGRLVHVMYCPYCGFKRYYVYNAWGRIRRVG